MARVLLNVEDYHQQAKEKLPKMIYDFYSTGSDDQLTLINNQQSFRRVKLRPKMLIDVSSHLTINSINSLHRLANIEHGELGTVRAAVVCSIIMCVSTSASIRMELIAEEYQKQIKINYCQSTSQL